MPFAAGAKCTKRLHLVHADLGHFARIVSEHDADSVLTLLALDLHSVAAEQRQLLHRVQMQRHHAVVVIDCIVYDEAVGILLLHHWRCGTVHTEHPHTHVHDNGKDAVRMRAARITRKLEPRKNSSQSTPNREGSYSVRSPQTAPAESGTSASRHAAVTLKHSPLSQHSPHSSLFRSRAASTQKGARGRFSRTPC